MLEKYEGEFSAEEFIKKYMTRKSVTRSLALQQLRKEIPKESYYQDKIKKGLKKRYKNAFVRKIAQSRYSEAGTPDVMCVIDGHYFGFEVKRPIVGVPSKLQSKAIREIEIAGGTAVFVTWPEECYEIIDTWRAGRPGQDE